MRDQAFSAQHSPWLDKILYRWRSAKAKKHLAGKTIVCDLGCGEEGAFLQTMAGQLRQGIGLDLGAETSQHPKIKLAKADLNQVLPLKNETAEAVTSLAVIEHLNHGLQHICEAFRVLAPDGRLIITTPAKHGDWLLKLLAQLKFIRGEEIDDHKHYFNKLELVSLCRQAGFKRVMYQRFQFGFNQLIVADK